MVLGWAATLETTAGKERGVYSHRTTLVPMSDSFQDMYAKHLPYAPYGYPLRMPEPMGTLPPNYQDHGLEIGDVGIVGRDGQFDVLFNICGHSDNYLHHSHGVPENFQPVPQGLVRFSENAIAPGFIHSQGITRIIHPKANEPRYPSARVLPYRFLTDSVASGQPNMNLPRPLLSALFLYCRSVRNPRNSYLQNGFARWQRRMRSTGMNLPKSTTVSNVSIAPFISSPVFTKHAPGHSALSTILRVPQEQSASKRTMKIPISTCCNFHSTVIVATVLIVSEPIKPFS